MRLVANLKEILRNLKTLDCYRISNNPDEAEFYRKLILRGICLIIHQSKGQMLWGPSRFVGYKLNSMAFHIANGSKDGRETNREISAILGYPPNDHNVSEGHYKRHCRTLGLSPMARGPFGVIRKYWMVP